MKELRTVKSLRCLALCCVYLWNGAAIATEQHPADATQTAFAPGAHFERVSAQKFTFTEGVVTARDGTVYFVDMDAAGGTIYRVDPRTRTIAKVMSPSGMANGLTIDGRGDLLIAQAGARAIVRRNLKTGAITTLADRYQGDDPIELPNAVYRIDPDGSIARVAADVERPNGIEVSPDGKRLYVAVCNTHALPPNPLGPMPDRFGIALGAVVAYDLDAQGNTSNGRVIYRDDKLGADGMAMDSDGNLYVALHNEKDAGEIVVLDPSGTVLAKMMPPTGVAPVNLGFGRGEDAGWLYLNSGFGNGALWRIRTARRGLFRD